MLEFTEQLSEALSIPVGAMPSANKASDNTNAAVVGPVNMSLFKRIMGIAVAGVITANTNTQVYLQSSNANNGTFSNISTTNQVVTLDASNTVGTVEVRADQLPAGNNWVQMCLLTSGGANTGAFLAALLIAGHARYSPANGYDANNTYIKQRLVY